MAATTHHQQSGTTTHHPSGHKSWYTTPNPFEHQFGYHRAIKRGPFIFVSGTTALKEVTTTPNPPPTAHNPSSLPPPQSPQQNPEKHHHHHQTTDQGPPYYRHHKKSLQYTESEIPPSPPPLSSSPSTHPFLAERESRSKVHHPTSAKLQAQIAMERCVDAVEKLGGKREDVVRVRMFVAHHGDCSDVGAAFRDCFGGKKGSLAELQDEKGETETGTGTGTGMDEVGAAATMIVVQNGFVDADILVEVELDAVVV